MCLLVSAPLPGMSVQTLAKGSSPACTRYCHLRIGALPSLPGVQTSVTAAWAGVAWGFDGASGGTGGSVANIVRAISCAQSASSYAP